MRLRGLFIGRKKILEALEFLLKSEVSLLVCVGNSKHNPRRKKTPNPFRFAVFYCGKILA
jgi:hypothetical protein